MILPEPTNEPNGSGYGLRALTWANQWVKLLWIWLAWFYLSQPMSQIVRDMAGAILPEPTNEPNSSRYGLCVLTWANQVSKLFRIWLACSYLSQPTSRIVLDMACVILPEPTNEPNGWDLWLTAIHDCQSLLRNFFLSAYKILGIKMSFRKSVTFLKRNKVLTCSTGTTHLAMYALNYIKNSS
jgi:hypothetical protein